MDSADDELIFDWNRQASSYKHNAPPLLFDESLRDGIQSPSVSDPSLDAKKRHLDLLESLGVQFCDIGLPGAGKRAFEDVVALAKHLVDTRYALKPACAARTHAADIIPVIEASQSAGIGIEVMAFIGSSPVRALAEDWNDELLAERTRAAVSLGVSNGLPVTFVTEDTIRSRPQTLKRLFQTALDQGASGLCLCDTVGHATWEGVHALIRFVRDVVFHHGTVCRLDWHGHNDRGLALSNALAALDAGVDRVHGTVLGIGERVGNTSLDLLIVNLFLKGQWPHDVSFLPQLCENIHENCSVIIPANYPVMGTDAFRTATGVHAAAVIKAMKSGREGLADLIYSGVPAARFGRRQEIEIGPMSGLSNVLHWLRVRQISVTEGLGEFILAEAKTRDHVMSEVEIRALIGSRA